MLSSRARQYEAEMERLHGCDHLRDLYETKDPTDYDPFTGYPEGRVPFEEWVEQQAFAWAMEHARPAPVPHVVYDVRSERKAELARLREQYRRWPTEDLMERIVALSYALGEEEIA